jgi:acyl-CoA thioesterase-1
MATIYTFGDSVLDCARYNDHDVHPGALIVQNDDALFPEFRGQDLAHRGGGRLVARASDGAMLDALGRQSRDVAPDPRGAALVSIGGNDLLQRMLLAPSAAVEAFGRALEARIAALPIRPVFLANVYDPTFGEEGRESALLSPGADRERARANHRRVNQLIAEVAARHGALVDLHTHFLESGDPSWVTSVIEPSLRGASEIRRCFLPHVLAWREALGAAGA